MGNSESVASLLDASAAKMTHIGKITNLIIELTNVNRSDLAEQLVLPLIADATLSDICQLISEKNISKYIVKKILDAYNPAVKEEIQVPKHVPALLRHLEILDKSILTDRALHNMFEYIIEKYDTEKLRDKSDLFESIMGFATTSVIGTLTVSEISQKIYDFLEKLTPEQLITAETKTGISRFDLAPAIVSIVELKRFKNLAPMPDFVDEQWMRIEKKCAIRSKALVKHRPDENL